MHFIFEPCVEVLAAPSTDIQQHVVCMQPDPCPAPSAQEQRFTAVVRLPKWLWISYEYITGEMAWPDSMLRLRSGLKCSKPPVYWQTVTCSATVQGTLKTQYLALVGFS